MNYLLIILAQLNKKKMQAKRIYQTHIHHSSSLNNHSFLMILVQRRNQMSNHLQNKKTHLKNRWHILLKINKKSKKIKRREIN
jgi:hypothetical protein